MHEAQFAFAASPPPAVVLHLPLKPYSIGHEIELLRRENPLIWAERSKEAYEQSCKTFAALPASQQKEWLARAVDFCSQDHDEWLANEKIFQSRPHWWQWRAWRKKIKLQEMWNQWERILDAMTETDWMIAVAEFRNYLIAGRSAPPAPTESGYKYANGNPDAKSGRQLGSPVQARVLNFLSGKTALLGGKSIYDFPFGLALWLCFTDGETEGTVAIENEAERAVDAKEKELLAEIEAERKAEADKAKEEVKP